MYVKKHLNFSTHKNPCDSVPLMECNLSTDLLKPQTSTRSVVPFVALFACV